MKIQVGLLSRSSMWEQLLAQEGVAFSYLSASQPAEEFSCIIVNSHPEGADRFFIEAYLNSGGAMIGYAKHINGIFGSSSRTERIDYLVSDHDDLFANVHLIDLALEGEIPREANTLRTQAGTFAAFAGMLGGGFVVVVPFDMAAAMSDTRAVSKNFYARPDRLPSERVSVVSKGEVRQLLHAAIVYLHAKRNLPYVHNWYFPDGKRNVFAFRIDSDKGSRKEVDDLYHIALSHNVGMTWFLDVKSHEDFLQHFTFMTQQEMSVHCYEHQTFESFDANLKNISKAKHAMHLVGLSAPGFAAPFGIWNTSLAKAIDTVAFDYSSEFSFLHDSFPLYPSDGAEPFLTPQVPIHPICIGSLRRVGYTDRQMKEYFRTRIEEKLQRDEPLFFYHHPTHHYPVVMEDIFQCAQEHGIGNMCMVDFVRWWGKRLKFRSAVTLEGDVLHLEKVSQFDNSVWLRIIHPDGREARIQPSERIDTVTLPWQNRVSCPAPSDIQRIREFDPRSMLGNLFTTLSKKISGRNTAG